MSKLNWKVYTVPPVLLAATIFGFRGCNGPHPIPAPPPIVAPVDPPAPPAPPVVPIDPPVVMQEVDQILALVNQERRSRGLVEVRFSSTLHVAAQDYAELMGRQNRLSHTLDGAVWDRIEALGYRYSTCGENIAWNCRDAAHVMDEWMKSPGHRANILNPDFRELGVGIAKNAAGEKYHCQVFGTPR